MCGRDSKHGLHNKAEKEALDPLKPGIAVEFGDMWCLIPAQDGRLYSCVADDAEVLGGHHQQSAAIIDDAERVRVPSNSGEPRADEVELH